MPKMAVEFQLQKAPKPAWFARALLRLFAVLFWVVIIAMVAWATYESILRMAI